MEQAIYVNSQGQKLYFSIIDPSSGCDKPEIWLASNDLHDYSWDYTENNDKISFFSRGLFAKKMRLHILADSEERAKELKTKVFEVVEIDVLQKSEGRLYYGNDTSGYYLTCFVTESTKTLYRSKCNLTIEWTLTVAHPYWIKETNTVFNIDTSAQYSGYDYPHDYTYDFGGGNTADEVYNDAIEDCDFQIKICGMCKNPEIYVAGNLYTVNIELGDGESVIIDSRDKTIYKYNELDGYENVFHLRGKGEGAYIFEKIPSGNSYVNWSGAFKFEITLYQNRSEPPWI